MKGTRHYGSNEKLPGKSNETADRVTVGSADGTTSETTNETTVETADGKTAGMSGAPTRKTTVELLGGLTDGMSSGDVRADAFRMETIAASAPMGIFEHGEEIALQVGLSGPATRAAVIAYDVSDYWSDSVRAGEVIAEAGQTSVEVTLGRLDKGYYSVRLRLEGSEAGMKSSFAVVVPASERKPLDDSPFAIDTAASLLVDASRAEAFARAIKLTGATWVRDRLSWTKTNPLPGHCEFALHDAHVRAIAAQGVRVLNVYHDSPEWTRSEIDKLPLDLLSAYDFAKRAGAYFAGQVQAWEPWNEPNIHFTTGSESADQYAAFLKASAIGFADGCGGKALVSNAGLAGTTIDYMDQLMDNEPLPFIDIYNFHAYPKPFDPQRKLVPAPGNADFHASYRKARGGEDKPMWLTECGLHLPFTDTSDISAEDQVRQARYVVTSTVCSLASGVAKHFWFVMPGYSENKKQFGMMSADYTPYPSYVAEATMTGALGEARFIGKCESPEGVVLHLFRDGSDRVAVVWAERETEIEWKLPVGRLERTDMMGRNTVLAKEEDNDAAFVLKVGPDPIYLRADEALDSWLGESNVRGGNSDDGRPERPGGIGSDSAAGRLASAQRVVLAQRYGREAREYCKALGAYRLRSGEDGDVVHVEVYNFNDRPMEGTVQGEVDGEWSLSPGSQPVRLPPLGKETLVFRIIPTPDCTYGVKAKVAFRGTFGGESTTISRTRIAARLDRIEPAAMIAGAEDPTRWLLDTPGGISPLGTGTVTEGSVPGAVRFKYAFKESACWAFPYFFLPEGSDFEGCDGFVYELFAERDVPSCDLKMLVNLKNGGRYFTPAGATIRAGWNKIALPFEMFLPFQNPGNTDPLDTGSIRSVQIGINTGLQDVPAFEIKRFGVYRIDRNEKVRGR